VVSPSLGDTSEVGGIHSRIGTNTKHCMILTLTELNSLITFLQFTVDFFSVDSSELTFTVDSSELTVSLVDVISSLTP